MTNEDDFATAYKRHREALKTANALNKTAVFDALAVTGIDTVIVCFDGEGDEGQIDDVAAFVDGKPAEIPADMVTILRTSANVSDTSDGTYPQDSKLPEAIEDLCYDYLDQKHGGWENNDGAFGEFQFDVKARTISLEFNGRYSDFLTSNYSL